MTASLALEEPLVLSSLVMSVGEVRRSRALFHAPERIGEWVMRVRLSSNAALTGQTVLHAPQ